MNFLVLSIGLLGEGGDKNTLKVNGGELKKVVA